MATTEIICPRCGWHNGATARMCAGCGQPLPVAMASPGARSLTYPQGEEPTDPDIQARGSAGRSAQGQMALGGQQGGVGGCLARGLLVVSVVALVAIFGCAALWGVVLRPAIHSSIDNQIRTQLQAVVSQANAGMPALASELDGLSGKSGTNSISSAALNQSLAASVPAGSPVQNAQLTLGTGEVTLSYTTYGVAGSISTHLFSQNNRPHASGTTITGLLAFVESGQDLEDDMNNAFATLQPTVAVTKIDISADSLTFTLQATQ